MWPFQHLLFIHCFCLFMLASKTDRKVLYHDGQYIFTSEWVGVLPFLLFTFSFFHVCSLVGFMLLWPCECPWVRFMHIMHCECCPWVRFMHVMHDLHLICFVAILISDSKMSMPTDSAAFYAPYWDLLFHHACIPVGYPDSGEWGRLNMSWMFGQYWVRDTKYKFVCWCMCFAEWRIEGVL